MDRKYLSPAVRAAGAALLFALATAASPGAARAQEEEREACRCVDENGQEIENCFCLRRPEVRSFSFAFGGEGAPRARIGVTVDPVQDEEADVQGARVTDVLEDGPAHEAGIRPGDIIVSVAGHDLAQPLDGEVEEDFDLDESVPVQRLLALARELEPGEEVEIVYLRDGERHTVTVEAEEVEGWGSFAFVSPEWNAEAFEDRMEALRERMERGELRFFEDARERMEEARERMEEARILGERAREMEDRGRVYSLAPPGEIHLRRGGRGSVVVAPEGRGVFRFRSEVADWMFTECPSPAEEEAGGIHVVWEEACLGGLELLEMKPGLAEYFGVESGVLVVDVHEESPTNLRPGDVILKVGDRRATSPGRVEDILRTYEEDEAVTFQVLRRGQEITVTGSLAR